MLSFILKICLIIIFIFFINKYNLVEKINDIIEGKTPIKEQFNNLILPKDDPIKIIIEDQLPIYNLGLVNKGNYLDEMSVYFKRHIFPIKKINTKGTLDNIFQLIESKSNSSSPNLDLAFVDEEILINFINNNNHIRTQSAFKSKLIDNNLPKINFAVLGVCFHQSFLFITRENSGILSYEDIKPFQSTDKKTKIGVLNEYNTDYYHLLKLFYLTDINPANNVDVELITYNDYNTLGTALYNKEVDIIYITSNKKNQMMFEITKAMKVRFISPKIKPEKYMFLNDNDMVNNFIEPPFIMVDSHNSRIEDVYLKYKTIYVLDTNMSEFNQLLTLSNQFIATDNTKKHILEKQVVTFKFEELTKIKKEIYDKINNNEDNNIVLFIPQFRRFRQRILAILPSNRTNSFVDLRNNKTIIENIDIEKTKMKQNYKNRDKLIKNMFHIIFDKTENLNTSYRNINTVSTLDTYSTRMLLVARNDLDSKYIEQIVENMIMNLGGLKDNINDYLSFETNETEEDTKIRLDAKQKDDNDTSNTKKKSNVNKNMLNSYVDNAFDFNALVSVKDIPIHKAAKSVYEKHGLIKRVTIDETDYIQNK
jgi:hypothetical protein